MKKIFAISFLSLMAVTGGARAEVEQYNLNLATAEYVDGIMEQLDNNKVSTWRVAESDETVTDNNKDFYIPTIARVDAAIANAKPDTSGLVAKTQVIKSDDKALSDGATDLSSANADEIVPTVGAVQEHFVPSVAVEYRDDWHGMVETAMRPGLYTIMVGVDADGNKTFIWQAVQDSRNSSSVGGAMPN